MLNSGGPFLRSQAKLSQRRAVEVVPGQEFVTLEAERAEKAAVRLTIIFYEFARTYAGIWSFCTPVNQKLLAQLDPAVRRKCSMVLLSRSLAGGPRGHHPC